MAEIVVVDDSGQTVRLEKAAERIVSLAPHLTENLFAIGAGNSVIAVSAFSNFPPQAQQLPSVGDFQHVNVEKIISLQPDLVVAWVDGGDTTSIGQLQKFGIPVYWSKPNKIAGIVTEFNHLGKLTGKHQKAGDVIAAFNRSLASLNQYQTREKIPVFYQVWSTPLQTLNKNTLINDVISLCGGVNVFAEALATVPQVAMEQVIAKNPEVILGSHAFDDSPAWPAAWSEWPMISAVANQRVHSVNADWLSRHTARILLGAQEVCRYLEQARISE